MAENESSSDSGRPRLRTTGLAAGVPEALRAVLARLSAAGHRALVVGGSVRDLCLSRPPVDQDVATSARAEEVLVLFPDARPNGERFGSVAVPAGGELVEVTSFRREGPYSDGRRPDWVAPARDEHEDAVRRDFTINALYLDVVADQLIDPIGGVADLGNALLRAIGAAPVRLQEDALRSLRAARFVARYDLRVEPALAVGGGGAAPHGQRCAPALGGTHLPGADLAPVRRPSGAGTALPGGARPAGGGAARAAARSY